MYPSTSPSTRPPKASLRKNSPMAIGVKDVLFVAIPSKSTNSTTDAASLKSDSPVIIVSMVYPASTFFRIFITTTASIGEIIAPNRTA